MARVILTRLLSMAGILLSLAAIEFILQQASPVDPVKVLLGPGATASSEANLRSQLGLDKPLPIRFLNYISDVVRGNLGISLRTQNSVRSDILTALPTTIELCVLAAVLIAAGAVLLAVSGASKWRTAGIIRGAMVAAASAPPFLFAILGIFIVANKLHWIPGSGATAYQNAPSGPTGFLIIDSLLAGEGPVALDALHHLIFPAICVAAVSAVAVGRVFRGSLIDNLNSDHVRTARSIGLTERVVLRRHVVRNSVGPALSMTGLQLGAIFAADVVVEQIFGLPGLGQLLAESILTNDATEISAITLILGVGYVVTNTIVDIAQAVADPRIRI